jgi:hypothetical protein
MSARGDFEVVWHHGYSSAFPISQDIFARHFDRQGRPTQAAPRAIGPVVLRALGQHVELLNGKFAPSREIKYFASCPGPI